jgi:hypothetical protein
MPLNREGEAGIDAQRFASRKPAGGESDSREAGGNQEVGLRILRAHAEEKPLEEPAGGKRHQEPQGEPGQREARSLDQDHVQDVSSGGPQSQADANLLSAQPDAVSHQPGETQAGEGDGDAGESR